MYSFKICKYAQIITFNITLRTRQESNTFYLKGLCTLKRG